MSSNRPPSPRGDPGPPRVDPNLEVREHRRGRRPGDSYVRIVRPFEEEFEHEEGRLVATERTMHGRTGWRRSMRGLRPFLIGRPISSEHEQHERLTKVKGLAIFSSDNISSSAYGPEEILRVLALAGAGALSLTLPIAALIIAMLAVVAVVAVVRLSMGNLRGIRESGSIFMATTYLYIVTMLGIVAYAFARSLAGDLPPYVPPPDWTVEQGTQVLGLFLLLRAFSQGAVALTGVEAISDGVPAFKPPEWRNARTTHPAG